jgi:uncharacterized ion transporter superfamily protein YfcC
MKSIKTVHLPHTLALIFIIIVAVWALTWLIPSGEFERLEKGGRTLVVPGTYHRVEANPQSVGTIFSAPLRGLADAANIVGVVLICGGAFGVVNATGAIHAAFFYAIRATERSALVRRGAIPVLTLLFSLGGATFGMSEEILAFIVIFVPFAKALGYDSIVGVAIPLVGSGAGFAAAFLNPFTVGLAQGIAELPLFSGIEYRLIVWAVVTALAIMFIVRYAERVKRNPASSRMYEIDHEHAIQPLGRIADPKLSRSQKFVLAVFAISLLALIAGTLKFDWYIIEIGALFLAMGIVAGLAGRLRINQIAEAFLAGTKDMIAAALVVAFSRGILVVATEGKIIDTILYTLAGFTGQGHPLTSAYLMLFVQAGINFFVPSGSGQAALTMPIMAPLSDLLGISRQTAVLIFQFGDGFNNLIIPTSGVTMGALSIANIPYEKWLPWVVPLQILLFVAGMVLIAIPVFAGWGPH